MHSVLRFASVHMNFFAGVYFSKKKKMYILLSMLPAYVYHVPCLILGPIYGKKSRN